MSMVSDVKTALRISHNALDAQIGVIIEAAKQRLRMIGAKTVDEDDPVTKMAIQLYAQGHLNYQGDGERYMQAFESLAKAMALCGDYNGEGCDCDV